MHLMKVAPIALCTGCAFAKPVSLPDSAYSLRRSLASRDPSIDSGAPRFIIPGCTQYYVVVPGQTCIEVAQRFGLDVNTFMSWNPSVNPPACSDMWAGYGYCVAMARPVPASPTTTTSQSTRLPDCVSKPTATPLQVSSSTGGCGKNLYKTYSGDGSIADGWPSVSDWVDFDCMFAANVPLMQTSCSQWGVPKDSAIETASIKNAIKAMAAKSNIDPRFILAIMMQESQGCVRVITTNWGVTNPGLMQSHNGNGTCNSSGDVQTPCPYSEIFQMIYDGTMGTLSGDGLVQLMKKQAHTDTSRWYRTARMYNGGGIQDPQNLDKGCCTSSYASDIANRLTGWTTAPRNFMG